MAAQLESTFKTRDGTSLYTKTWKSSTPSNLHLIFIHGFSDHINAYYDLFPTLSRPPYNITTHGFDQRGWGRSVPPKNKSARGRTGDTKQVLTDIHDFIIHTSQEIRNESSNTATANTEQIYPKLFLMGHSMGGAEALHYLLKSPSSISPYKPHPSPSSSSSNQSKPLPISGLIIESPHIAFPPSSQPSALLVISGRLASKFLPNHQMVQKLDSSAMSRNPQVCKDWDNDELCHDTGTLRGLAGLLDRAEALNELGSNGGKNKKKGVVEVGGLEETLPCPVFWGHGTKDMVCDFGSSKRLYERVVQGGDGGLSRFKGYEGGYHKIHGEPEGMGEEFARDVGEWIVKVGGGAEGSGASDSGKDEGKESSSFNSQSDSENNAQSATVQEPESQPLRTSATSSDEKLRSRL